MNFELVDYQEQAATDIVAELLDAADAHSRRGRNGAVSLSAPTGAGKTVIAAAVLERLMYGHDDAPPNDHLTVLWITDNPSLNAQTQLKLAVASDRLDLLNLVTVDHTVDTPVLDAGHVFFLNTQKLGRGARTYRAGDHRQYDLWDIVGNTIRARGKDFLLVIDEAHRGTGTSASDTADHTILARLIHGTGQSGAPAPVVLGITATPQRFMDTIGASRGVIPIVVDPEDVRRSGLVKSDVAVNNPRETQPSDATLVELATEQLGVYTQRWADYAHNQGEPPVVPVMVVQLPAAVTDTAVAAVIDTLQAVNPGLKGAALAHALQDHTAATFGTHTVRYLAPERIQDDPYVRVVLFKEALTTGWDCPRAEVMVSLRKAQDDTYITQLIGRMVRTPLARKPESDGFLDSVQVHLPHFDHAAVDRVIDRLRTGDDSITSQVVVNPVQLERNPAVPDAAFDAVEALPSYTRPAATFRNEVARLNRMATLLEGNGILPGATKVAREMVVEHLVGEIRRLGKDVAATATDYEQIDFRTRTVDWLTGRVVKTVDDSRRPSVRNVDDLFASARRRLGDAAGPWLLQRLVEQAGADDADVHDLKIRVAALAAQPGVRDRLDDAAGSLVTEWHRAHRGAVADLPEAVRAKFDTILEATTTPVLVSPILPERGRPTAPMNQAWAKHLYAGPDGMYPAALNGWEARVVQAVLQRDDTVAWYRNPTGGKQALAVPWTTSHHKPKTLYPDFLVVRDAEDGLVVDVIDPHDPSRSDTVGKWVALAGFAATHAAAFGKVLAVIVNEAEELVAVDLRAAAVGAAIAAAQGEAGVRLVFSQHGFRL